MEKYIIISQEVYTDDMDDISILPVTYNSIDEANQKLIELHSIYYDKYDTKLLNYDYLFIYTGFYNSDNKYKYTYRHYYRINTINI